MKNVSLIFSYITIYSLIFILSCNILPIKKRIEFQLDDQLITSLMKDSYDVFKYLRNDIGVYADAARLQGKQFHPSSVATIGMGLISLCIADKLSLEKDAEKLAHKTLLAITGNVIGFKPARNQKGYFRHWINMETGKREWNSEYSSIDTAILLAGALFCKNYFSSNSEIKRLSNELYYSIDWEASIANSRTGRIFMTFDEKGNGLSTTRPFNEYILVAWFAKNYKLNKKKQAEILWQHYFEKTENLPKTNYDNLLLLTDREGAILSSFVIQFAYYLCNYFTTNQEYKKYMLNAALADKRCWQTYTSFEFIWGFGAGASNYGYGYHADNCKANPGVICSPHIISGFIPAKPDAINDLIKLYHSSLGVYFFPNPENKILWRFSLENPDWSANDIQGVDFATMLFGLAAHPNILGERFFSTNNQFTFVKP